jgi:hypothetical protein
VQLGETLHPRSLPSGPAAVVDAVNLTAG